MGRVKTYEAKDIAKAMAETFKARPAEEDVRLNFSWPSSMHHIGNSLGIAYSSDKWRTDGSFELWKHIAESPNAALVRKGFVDWDVMGPTRSLVGVPMPKHYAELALFEEINIELFNVKTRRGYDVDGDTTVTVKIPGGVLCGSVIRWSQISNEGDQPFLFVYTEDEGIVLIVTGDELDIEADGIVG